MSLQPQWIGATWQESATILPRLVTAVSYTKPATGLSGRITHPFWVIDYSRSHCGSTRVGSTKSPWIKRPPGIAHLYPPDTPYWEDHRNATGIIEGAYIVFAGGDEAELHHCIPEKQQFARITDLNGMILRQLHAAAAAGREKGAAGFWKAQAALCDLIRILHQTIPAKKGAPLTIGPAPMRSNSPFVKATDSFLASRVGSRVTLNEIAGFLRVSPSTLSHRYTAETGKSPLSAFNAMRLEAARSLILRGLKLEAVAAQTGFSDAYHLSKMFSQHFSESPALYRHRIKAEI